MVLDEEVRDINGRLLLKKGKNIQSAHIRIFKIWGVTEVNICGNNGSKNTAGGNVDPEKIEKIKEYTHKLFCHTDLEHPALKEIFRIAVEFRSQYCFPEKEETIDLAVSESKQNSVNNNFLQELNQESITLPEIPSIVFGHVSTTNRA